MDLVEFQGSPVQRHPWETVRILAVANILQPVLAGNASLLDIGSGDGFAGRSLFHALSAAHYVGLDTNLSAGQLERLNTQKNLLYLNDYRQLEGRQFDCVLMLDVLEHAEDDLGLLRTVGENLKSGGWVMITAPAFQALFSAHDQFLRHFRRYRLRGVRELVQSAGMDPVAGGYLYSTLLIARLFSKFWSTVRPRVARQSGVGDWTHGRIITGFVEAVLRFDNFMLLAFNRMGLHLPGLSVWMLVRKP